MRRPLCVVCLAYVIALACCLLLFTQKQFAAEQFDGQKVVLSGKVDRIEYKNEKQILYLNHVSCDSSQKKLMSELFQFSNVSCICYMSEETDVKIGSYVGNGSLAEKESHVKIGSYVEISGTFRKFSKASNPGEFDYRSYCELQGIYFSIQKAVIRKQSSTYDPLRDTLYRIKEKGCEVFMSLLPEEDAGILCAMLLGDRTMLSGEDKTLFQKSGIAHILAISGLHISLIGMGIYKLLTKIRIPYTVNMSFCIGLMVLYGMMTGMSSSAGRAILMFAISLNAKRVGRTYDMLTALSVAAVWLLLERPRYVFHAGFQLSFGAVIGLACVKPAIDILFGDQGKGMRAKLLGSLSAGLSINLVTLPVLMYHYYEYSLYSVLFNLLVLPSVGLLAGCGMLSLLSEGFGGILSLLSERFGGVLGKCAIRLDGGVAGFSGSWGWGGWYGMSLSGCRIGQLFAKCCSILLKAYRIGGAWLIKLPLAVWITGRPKSYQIVLYGVFLLLFVLAAGKRKRIASCICLVVSVAVLSIRWTTGMRLTVLDVGQGDGSCIQVQSGHAILIDCGSVDQSKLAQYRLIPFLKSQGIHTVDAVFLSHLDEDHISAVMDLLTGEQSGIRVKKIIISSCVPRDDAWEKVTKAASEADVRICYMQAGDIYQNGELSIYCLYPRGAEGYPYSGAPMEGVSQRVSNDRNAMSLVLYMEYGSFQAVYAGDVDQAGELQALTYLSQFTQPENCDLIKVSHHGSKTSSAEHFLESLSPKLAVISCGEDNSYGHPHEDTLARLESVGASIYRTDRCGAIIVEIKNDNMSVREYVRQ